MKGRKQVTHHQYAHTGANTLDAQVQRMTAPKLKTSFIMNEDCKY